MKNMEAKITTAINLAVMGAGIAAAVAAANKSKAARVEASKIEKSISELSAKFDKMAEQLKVMQYALLLKQQKIGVSASGAKEAEKKSRGSPAAAATRAAGRDDVRGKVIGILILQLGYSTKSLSLFIPMLSF